MLLFCMSWLQLANVYAQGYQPTDLSSTYTYSTVYYIDIVDADGKSISEQYSASDGVVNHVIGAFVGDELRGAGYAAWASENNVGHYVFTVRAWTTEAATLEFRAKVNDIEYRLATRDIAAAENTVGTPSNPIQMRLIPVTGISITPNPISLVVDGTADFSINYLPKEHSALKNEPGFQCSASSDSPVVPFSVDESTKTLKGESVGKGTLNVYAGQWQGSATVDVKAKTIPVTGIENNETSLDLEKWVGDVFTLNFSILPADATNKNVIYEIGDQNVITPQLNASGRFNAKAKGTTTIKVSTLDGNKTLTYNIIVKQHVTGIDVLNPNNTIRVPVGTNITEYLNNNAISIFKVLPANADNKEVTYTAIRADGIMTTKNGVITATGVGSCLVQIASKDVPNITTTVNISVFAIPTSIAVDTPAEYYYVGEDSHLTYSVLPQGTPQDVTITSADASIVAAGTAANGAFTFSPKQKGTATLTIASKEYPDIKTTITINVRVRVTSIAFKNPDMTIVRDTKIPITADMFTIEPANGDLDLANFKFSTVENITNGLRGLLTRQENNGSWYMIGLTPYPAYTLQVSTDIQDTNISCTVNVQDMQELASGWNWIGMGYDIENAGIFYNAIGHSFVEARSKSALIYNDTKYGYFGDLEQLAAGEGYKMKTTAVTTVTTTTNDSWLNGAISLQTRVGWNWLANPHPRATTISQLIASPSNGDIVKTLDHVAAYEANKWSSDLTISEHEAFMYKASAATSFRWAPGAVMDTDSYVEGIIAGGTANARQTLTGAERLWNYDAHRFAGNMGIIAAGEGLDDADRYTIGAFVGGECRGQGTLCDGKWYVVAHLQGGEEVSLRLYDRQTETFHALTIDGRESLGFTEMAGSLSRPLTLGATTVTAIRPLTAGDSEYSDAVVTDLSGKMVQSGHININQLPKGVYILTTQGQLRGQARRAKFVK